MPGANRSNFMIRFTFNLPCGASGENRIPRRKMIEVVLLDDWQILHGRQQSCARGQLTFRELWGRTAAFWFREDHR
jgi:hypothetical protein